MHPNLSRRAGLLLALLTLAPAALAWDYEGHRTVNQLALASLPTNFPAFALTPDARARIAFSPAKPTAGATPATRPSRIAAARTTIWTWMTSSSTA